MTDQMDNFRITASQDGSRQFRNGGEQQFSRGSHKGGRGFRGRRNNPYNNRQGGQRRTDEDVAMDGDAGSSGPSNTQRRFNPYGSRGRRGRHGAVSAAMDRPNNGDILSRLGVPFVDKRKISEWYRVSIPHGKKLDKDFILKSIGTHANMPFSPVCFNFEGHEAVFFVRGANEANAIRGTTKRITTPNGMKMIVQVNPSGPPASPVNETTVAKLKECMSKRYDVAAFSLNLSDLDNDEDLKQSQVFLSLRRPQVVKKVLEIIGEHIPQLKVLDLSKNRMEEPAFAQIEEKAPQIQQLNLAQNRIRYERELHVFGKLNLVELCLDGNPLCDRFRDQQTYISAIRKRFPNILKLDGNVLPPPITFDIETPTTLPEPKGSFFMNDKRIEELICNFVNQYFALYDSSNRQPLINAYHDQALFSLASYNVGSWSGRQPSLSEYNRKCRNHVQNKDNVQRENRLKIGRDAIVGVLSELPNTQHDLQSFVVDVSFAVGSMVTLTINGVFKELSNKSDKDIIRQFSRMFVVQVNGDRLAITNEMLTVTNIHPDSAKKYFQSPPVVQQPAAVAPVAAAAAVAVSPEMKQSMVVSFAQQSGMNENFSKLCLEQNDWNYDRAAAVFLDMKQKNGIPPEAFVK